VTPDLSGPGVSAFERDLHALTAAIVNEVAPGQSPSLGGPWDHANFTQLNLSGVNLRGAFLDGAVLVEADLSGAVLEGASLTGCVLTGARLTRAMAADVDMTAATLGWADISDADLQRGVFRRANLSGVVAQRTNLRQADFFFANLVEADLTGADLTGCNVYGISAWDVELRRAVQRGLVITKANDPAITVDDLQVAQFLYLLIRNEHIRSAIDTLTTKLVLILGRFTPRRKRILRAVGAQLRARHYVPVLFDFDRPASRDFTETVVTLAHLARFIVADLTDPASLPKELEAIVPDLAIPVVPLIESGKRPFAMFPDYWKYDWVLPVQPYDSVTDLRARFDDCIVTPAERKARQLSRRRARALDG
jgi:hypothetical protein